MSARVLFIVLTLLRESHSQLQLPLRRSPPTLHPIAYIADEICSVLYFVTSTLDKLLNTFNLNVLEPPALFGDRSVTHIGLR